MTGRRRRRETRHECSASERASLRGGASRNGRYLTGSSYKCVHDLARSRSSTRSKKVADVPVAGLPRGSRLSLSRRPPEPAPLLVGGLLGGSRPHRKVLILWHLQRRGTMKAPWNAARLSTTFRRWEEPSPTVQPLGTGRPLAIPPSAVAGFSGRPQLPSRYRRCPPARKSLIMLGLIAMKAIKSCTDH